MTDVRNGLQCCFLLVVPSFWLQKNTYTDPHILARVTVSVRMTCIQKLKICISELISDSSVLNNALQYLTLLKLNVARLTVVSLEILKIIRI